MRVEVSGELSPASDVRLLTIDSRPQTILLIKPGSLGDVVHALPVASALHRAWPETRLSWVIDPRWQPVLAGHPAVDECVVFPRERFRGPAGLLRSLQWFAFQRNRRPDLAIDLQCLLRSALIASTARSQRIIGLSDAREGADAFYHETARVTDTQHAVDRYLRVLPLLGIPIPPQPEFILAAGEPMQSLVPDDFIILHPYARGMGKSLDSEAVFKLSEHLSPTPVLLVGIGSSPQKLPSNVIDLTNRTTLAQLIWLLRRARCVVSVDSGPMHLAASVDVPLLSIHTWSDPRRVGPYSAKAWIWQGGELRPQNFFTPLRPQKPITDQDLRTIVNWAFFH